LTIVSSKKRYFKGFMVTMTTQVGCATTGDYPSEETEREVDKYHTGHLDRGEAMLVEAYRHLVEGRHPFTRFRRHLDTELAPKGDDQGLTLSRDPDRASKSDPIYLQRYLIELFMKDGTPEAVRNKVAYDFLLSQTYLEGTDLFEHCPVFTAADFFV